MILSFKHIFFVVLIFLGFYFFYSEYKIIINVKHDFKEEDDLDLIINNNITAISEDIKSDELLEEQKDINHHLKKINIIISEGDTFLSILRKFNLSENEIYNIISEIEKFFDLKKLKVNSVINIFENNEKKIKKIEIFLDFDNILIVGINDDISINKEKLEKISYQLSSEFNILESLYSDGLKNNLPQEILIKLIKLFSFDLDFQRDIKRDTIVSVSYELDQIKDNNEIRYKDIVYALISIEGKDLEYFKFITDDGYLDYFNRQGKNVKKSILKTPLDGARLSSSFGMRKHPISGFNKMHKGVDFAAPRGTPIYAGGNGVVEYVGRNGGYGNYIRIRHNNEYKTAYAHLSGFKKGITKGVRVNQGDVIGYVGNTGNSTGPHLHYEIIFQNKQINPMKLKLPSGKKLKGKEFERFTKELKIIYANHLNLLYE